MTTTAMPDLNLEQEREKFEHYERASELTRNPDGSPDDYANPCVESSWTGWLAAKRSIAQEVAAQESLSAAIMALRYPDIVQHPDFVAGFTCARHAAAELVAASLKGGV